LRAIVGLGNPEPAHVATRHNLGFWVAERLLRARRWRAKRFPWGQVAWRREGLVLRPTTYMNRSGEAVAQLVARYGVRPNDLLIILDDIELAVGALRLRPHGGAGTHNGLRSVLEKLGTQGVPRLRVGVGAPPPGVDAADYVLAPPERDEVPLLEQASDLAAELALTFLDGGLDAALDRFSRARLAL